MHGRKLNTNVAWLEAMAMLLVLWWRIASVPAGPGNDDFVVLANALIISVLAVIASVRSPHILYHAALAVAVALVGCLATIVLIVIQYNYAPRRMLPACRYSLIVTFSVLLGVAGPNAAILRFRRTQHPPGHCQDCGYDLHGNPQAATCPECGAVIFQTDGTSDG